jgi:hypothetical protein
MMNRIKTFESYSNQTDFFSEIIEILKSKSITPVDINQIIDFYSDQIINYFNDGKSPNDFVDDNLSEIVGSDQKMIGFKFPQKWSGDIKYL